jgi:hypothetical protein
MLYLIDVEFWYPCDIYFNNDDIKYERRLLQLAGRSAQN